MTTSGPASSASILGIRDVRLFLGSRFLTGLGVNMQTVAVGWQIYDITGDPLALGYAGLAVFLPMALCTLPAGDIADRLDRRLVLAASFAGQLGTALLLLVLTLAATRDVAWFYAALALFGISRAFVLPTQQSFLPRLVPPALFPRAVPWSASAHQLATILGPALGGVIYILGPAAVYGTAAAFFAAAVAAIASIRTHGRQAPAAGDVAGMRAWHRLAAGIAFVRRTPILLGAISLDMFAVLLSGATALLPVYARDILFVGPEGLGILRSATAVGAAMTALALTRWPVSRHAGATLLIGVAVFGAATVVFGVSESFVLSVAALAIMGAADMVSNFVRSTVVQLATPDPMRGRVSGVNSLFISASNELGEFRAGVTAAFLGTVPAVVVGGVGAVAVVGLWAWLFPALRRVDRLADLTPAPPP